MRGLTRLGSNMASTLPVVTDAAAVPPPALERIEASSTVLGEGMRIRRVLPTRHRRMVGPWCFLDHFGPVDVSAGKGMRVGPHPHIGLQTVTWLFEGELLHRDSLGSVQSIRPGQLNLMTSGRGISHSEESPAVRPAEMHGLQFWIALPDAARNIAPAFDHFTAVPRVEHAGLDCALLVGEALGQRSPAPMHWPVMGLDVRVPPASSVRLPLDPAYEHAALVVEGGLRIEDEWLQPGTLLYLGGARAEVRIASDGPGRLAIIGGLAFPEPVLMWWNFVGRSKSELGAACREWNDAHPRFGEVLGYVGSRLPAPMPPWAE